MRTRWLLGLLILSAACGGASEGDKAARLRKNVEASAAITTLQMTDTKVGTGAEAVPGRRIKVHYTGTLLDGLKFDSSRDHGGEPFEFTLGEHEVIDGWDEGIKGMRVGGIRQLVIPASMGYGPSGNGENIPPNAALKFEVELLEVN